MSGYDDAYLELSGLTMTNWHCPWANIPGGDLGDEVLYHLFSSGLFERVAFRDPFGRHELYDRARQQRYVTERDRLEIRKLQAELRDLKEKTDAKRDPPLAAPGPGARGRSAGLGDPVRSREKPQASAVEKTRIPSIDA